MKVTVIDYGLSNLLSVRHPLEHFGAQVFAGVMSVLAVAGVAVFLIGMAGTGREEAPKEEKKVSMK